MANPKYGTTVPNQPLEIKTDKKIRAYWVESVDGAEQVWFTVDGADPQPYADGVFFLPAAAGAGLPFENEAAGLATVKFRSTGAVRVAVRHQ